MKRWWMAAAAAFGFWSFRWLKTSVTEDKIGVSASESDSIVPLPRRRVRAQRRPDLAKIYYLATAGEYDQVDEIVIDGRELHPSLLPPNGYPRDVAAGLGVGT